MIPASAQIIAVAVRVLGKLNLLEEEEEERSLPASRCDRVTVP